VADSAVSRSLRTELARLVGAEHVLEAGASSPYNHDATNLRGLAGRADVVVRPGSAQEVTALVGWCYEHDTPLIARGGGTGLAGGAVALEGGVVCSLERLLAVRELEPALWRMHVEAGISTRHVHRLARENGLFFPPDPGASEQSQIGGNVATNAGGPHAFKYGVTGNWVTGLEAVVAPGELISVGGPYRKDVAGYDLKSVLIGSEGTLGVITAVRLRLLPAPEAVLPLIAFQRTGQEGCRAILDVLASGVVPAALDFLDGEALAMACGSYPGEVPVGAGFALLAEADGTSAEAQQVHRELSEVLSASAIEIQCPDARSLWRWRDAVSGAVSTVRGGKVSEDIVVPVDRLAETLERFALIAAGHGLRSCAWGHGADGNVHANLLVDPANQSDLAAAGRATDELFALAVEMGGSISGEHGVGWLKRGQLAQQWSQGAVHLHERIKQAFDPKDLLNPGKKLARARAPERAALEVS
jgi:glycolate oxidase subunit GlcD